AAPANVGTGSGPIRNSRIARSSTAFRERSGAAGSILARAFAPQVTSARPAAAPIALRSPYPKASDLRLTGSITALATPFDVDGELDLDAWQRLIDLQLAGGTHAVVVAGSTGEAAALFDAEFEVLLRTAVERIGGRVPVSAGTGQSATAKAI